MAEISCADAVGILNGTGPARRASTSKGKKPPDDPELKPDTSMVVLSLVDWLKRDLPAPDPVIGTWITTTSRVMFYAGTGIGKSMVGLALGMRIAAGLEFLKWAGVKPRRVLYIDGEMAAPLLRERLQDEVDRVGFIPEGFYALSHEDIENFAPLDTPEGQKAIEDVIAMIGGVDFVIFDNIMCLISGDMKEEDGWRRALPWIKSLTARWIGQLWIHHTGHDGTHSYGTKTREWQLDTVIRAEPVKRDDTDVSMKLVFEKARQRRPDNRDEFKDAVVCLIDEQWSWLDAAQAGEGKAKAAVRTPKSAALALRALQEAIDALGSVPPASNYIPKKAKTVTVDDWRKYAYARGISNGGDRAQQLAFQTASQHLLAAQQVGTWQGQVWLAA